MTSKLAALAKILLLPRRSAPAAFVRPLQRIFGTTTTDDEIRTEPQENDDEEEQLEERQQQHKGILLEALMTRRGNLNSNHNTKYHKGEQVGGPQPITDPIAKHQLREVRNDYYRSAAINNNNYNNDNDDNSNFNTQQRGVVETFWKLLMRK
ncbi:hypothetical protein FRACYDRAFT_265876 [Fragilariopsis cylindrus CCMP1102]|uniref:Uncharacterized protein n=1 Tax=Fragilariopsis cylindrus CCMP1102 TaxID=635003 RepID=A0A1E7EKY7_9STRA|nr:hypothetical protein FRACYDRAFT_265876 [Fragilariopsis cylindrus CCMP1102]|eukprot:OEU06535.1 hypothetical protein FRACYDRAFT_265876 [Fragilariopsis cylindrus CCMP1102]